MQTPNQDAMLSPQRRNANNSVGWEEKTENSTYISSWKKKIHALDDSHPRVYSVLLQG